MAIHVRRLEKHATEGRKRPLRPWEVSREAAREVRAAALTGKARGRVLRLFTAGDASTVSSVRFIREACEAWRASGGDATYGYTHAWRVIPRKEWGSVSILASCETDADAIAAARSGYAPARVFPTLPEDGKAFETAPGCRWIPCPEQTRGVPCVACRLCFDSEALNRRGMGIAFAAHGGSAAKVRRRLTVLQGGVS